MDYLSCIAKQNKTQKTGIREWVLGRDPWPWCDLVIQELWFLPERHSAKKSFSAYRKGFLEENPEGPIASIPRCSLEWRMGLTWVTSIWGKTRMNKMTPPCWRLFSGQQSGVMGPSQPRRQLFVPLYISRETEILKGTCPCSCN